MNAEQASAARDMVANAILAADWIMQTVTSNRAHYADGRRTEPMLFVAEDLRDSAKRLEALIPPLPLVQALSASLAMEGRT